MTLEVLLLSVALACLLVHIKAMSNEKNHQKLSLTVRLLATGLEVLTTGGVFSTKASLPSQIKIGFYLNHAGLACGYMISILLEDN